MPEESVLPWSGEGPPPAGTVCEVDGSAGISGFDSCTILYSSRNVMVWQYIGTDFENCSYAGEREFRPIRTPEQIAKVERDSAVAQMKHCFDSVSDHLMPTSNQYLETLFGAIYDAGYRKQVMP